MHTKPDLRVLFKIKINRSVSVITAVITLGELMSSVQAERLRYSAIKMLEASQYRDAIVKLDELVHLLGHPADYVWRAQTLIALGRYRDALADCEYALAQDCNVASTRVAIAFLLAAAPDDSLRNGPAALQHAEIAAELIGSQPNWRFHNVLAAAHAECGDFETAVRFATESLNDAPPEFKNRFIARIEQYNNGIPYRATVESSLSPLDYRESICVVCGSPAFMRWPPGGDERKPRCVDCCSHETAENA